MIPRGTPGSPSDKPRRTGWILWLGVTVATSLLLFAGAVSDLPPTHRPPRTPNELASLLVRVRGAWEPKARERLITEAAERLRVLEQDLLEVLANHRHGYLSEAVQVVATVRLAGAR